MLQSFQSNIVKKNFRNPQKLFDRKVAIGFRASTIYMINSYNNYRFNKSDNITSPNGKFRAIWQNDENFVVYGPNGALWNTGTHDRNLYKQKRPFRLEFQHDNNLVIYSNDKIPVWNSNSVDRNRLGNGILQMQNDGNLVIYTYTGDWNLESSLKPMWYSKTSQCGSASSCSQLGMCPGVPFVCYGI
jgi:hypothetical protein